MREGEREKEREGEGEGGRQDGADTHGRTFAVIVIFSFAKEGSVASVKLTRAVVWGTGGTIVMNHQA